MRCRRVGFLGFVFLLLGLAAFADGPCIGLIYAESKFVKLDKSGKDDQRLYRDAVEENGGVVVVIAQTYDAQRVASALARIDGLLLPGGIDVDPKYYHEDRHAKLEKTDAALDALEFKALDYAKEHALPVLGVCRGHQLINVYYGGSLIQDIPSEHEAGVRVTHRAVPGSKEKAAHPVAIVKGSMLHELFGVERLVVNSYHHQAVKELAPGFVVTARTDDGIVEAIEYTGAQFILGVQFHPEKIRPRDSRFNAPFKRFIEEARKAQAKRERPEASQGEGE